MKSHYYIFLAQFLKKYRALVVVAGAMFLFFILGLLTLLFPMETLGQPAATVVPVEIEVPTEDTPIVPQLYTYVEVVDSCGPQYEGACVNLRTGPGSEFGAVEKLRTGVVLKTAGIVEAEGRQWYRVVFDEWLRYPERVASKQYVAAEFVRPFEDVGGVDLGGDAPPVTHKRIVVDRSDQKIYAYEDEAIFMEESISTGLDLTPTPRGNFKIFRKTPSRYMQGPIPEISDQYYDLPGVPWNLYFTEQGGAIHGAYWHNNFGQQWSHGCVNLPLDKAHELYMWAELGTPVLVRD